MTHYCTFYGLTEEPFRTTPDPRFFHLAEPYRHAFVTLLRGIVQRKGFLVVTGPIGAGKTTLLHSLLLIGSKLAGQGRWASAMIVNPTLTRDEFLENVLQELDVHCPSQSKPRRLLALHQLLLETQRRGGTTVLIVDEAHLLPVELLEEIRLLSNADSYREKLLQVILAGQPELGEVLNVPELRALKQRIAVRAYLRCLSLSETRNYISERLQVAGLKQPNPFSPEACKRIFEIADGVPRLINLLCDSCLYLAFQGQQKIMGPDLVLEAAASLNLDPDSYLAWRDDGHTESRRMPARTPALIRELSDFDRTPNPAKEDK